MLLFAFVLFALSEAREAFIKQFSSLEASTGTLLAQLHEITSALNCSLSMTEEVGKDEDSRDVCHPFAATVLIITASQKQLRQATLDMDEMVGRKKTRRTLCVVRHRLLISSGVEGRGFRNQSAERARCERIDLLSVL